MTDKDNTTYTATIIISSTGKNNDVSLSIEWSPELNKQEIDNIGFLPASFQFVEEFIVPALEEAYQASYDFEVEDVESRSVN